MPGNAMFLVFVFFRFFSDFVSILAHFWSSKGHLGAFKIKSFSIMAPRWSLRGLRGASGVDFGSVLVRSWIALGAILASGFGYNVFFLHETQHGFHIRFSFSPCSAAVRAQHMELSVWGHFSWRIRCSMNYLSKFLKKMKSRKIVFFVTSYFFGKV